MNSKRTVIIALILVAALFGFLYGELEAPIDLPQGIFVVKPYLQLGPQGKLSIVWQAVVKDEVWKVRYRTTPTGAWKNLGKLQLKKVSLSGIPPFCIFRCDATISDTAGFDYEIFRNDEIVFKAYANPRINSDTRDHIKGVAYSFAVFGDAAANTDAQKSVAYEIYKSRPNFVIMVGDLAYEMGRVREYFSNVFPIYNCDSGELTLGAPLMRSTMFVALPGNHDTGTASILPIRNLHELADGLAYFYEWYQPGNGPGKRGGINIPVLEGDAKHKADFLAAAQSSYPRMSNFYFDKGNARFVALDANDYMNWADKSWRDWLEKTLANAQNKTWRFVFFHQTAFSSDPHHSAEQGMRLIADILQRENVQLVFSGHCHNYQRTYPLQFKATAAMEKDHSVPGHVTLAESLLNATDVKNTGFVTYITTGAGGAELTGADIAANPKKWQPFTKKFIADVHSYTLCQVQGDTLVLSQISERGELLDEFSMKSSGMWTTAGSVTIPAKPVGVKSVVPLEPFPQVSKTPKKPVHHKPAKLTPAQIQQLQLSPSQVQQLQSPAKQSH